MAESGTTSAALAKQLITIAMADNVSLVMVEVCFSPLLTVALTANTNL